MTSSSSPATLGTSSSSAGSTTTYMLRPSEFYVKKNLRDIKHTVELNAAAFARERRATYDPIEAVCKDFARRSGMIVYGGTALNALLPEGEKIYTSDDACVNDVDCFSKTPREHATRLTNELCRLNIPLIQAMDGMHPGSVIINVQRNKVVDISPMDPDVFDHILATHTVKCELPPAAEQEALHWKEEQLEKEEQEALKEEQLEHEGGGGTCMNLVDKDVMLYSFHVEFAHPGIQPKRWEKMFPRFVKFVTLFPIRYEPEAATEHFLGEASDFYVGGALDAALRVAKRLSRPILGAHAVHVLQLAGNVDAVDHEEEQEDQDGGAKKEKRNKAKKSGNEEAVIMPLPRPPPQPLSGTEEQQQSWSQDVAGVDDDDDDDVDDDGGSKREVEPPAVATVPMQKGKKEKKAVRQWPLPLPNVTPPLPPYPEVPLVEEVEVEEEERYDDKTAARQQTAYSPSSSKHMIPKAKSVAQLEFVSDDPDGDAVLLKEAIVKALQKDPSVKHSLVVSRDNALDDAMNSKQEGSVAAIMALAPRSRIYVDGVLLVNILHSHHCDACVKVRNHTLGNIDTIFVFLYNQLIFDTTLDEQGRQTLRTLIGILYDLQFNRENISRNRLFRRFRPECFGKDLTYKDALLNKYSKQQWVYKCPKYITEAEEKSEKNQNKNNNEKKDWAGREDRKREVAATATATANGEERKKWKKNKNKKRHAATRN